MVLDELLRSQEKQDTLQKEFLLKIKALKKLSADKMRDTVAEATSNAKYRVFRTKCI